jgi:hypothetical protein
MEKYERPVPKDDAAAAAPAAETSGMSQDEAVEIIQVTKKSPKSHSFESKIPIFRDFHSFPKSSDSW